MTSHPDRRALALPATHAQACTTGCLENRAHALAALTTTLVGALLVPGVGFCETENAPVVALTLEASQRSLERLVGLDLDLDRHVVEVIGLGGKMGRLVWLGGP